MDHYARAYRIFSRIRGYRRYSAMHYSLRRFTGSEVARERFRIIEFYQRHGELATKEAFGVDRKLICVWKKRFKGNDALDALVPESTRPVRTRTMATDVRIVEFIRGMREKYPRMGKQKLKPLLDTYCAQRDIPSISESTIGKVIKRHKFFFQKSGRIYHNPDSKWASRDRAKTKRLRVKHPKKHKEFGHFQADTSFLFVDGMRRYFLSAIDTTMKFSFSSMYTRLNSKNSTNFIKMLETVYPLEIKSVQTDNGSEFLGDFDLYLKKQNVSHYFTYPRCPKINGCVERYNRTLKEEFIYPNLHCIYDTPAFQRKLAEYLIFYNTQRPHASLSLKSPLDYLISEGVMSKMSVTYTTIRLKSYYPV